MSNRTRTSSNEDQLSPEDYLYEKLGHNKASALLKGVRRQHNASLLPKFGIRLPFGAARSAVESQTNDIAKLARQYGWTPPDKQ